MSRFPRLVKTWCCPLLSGLVAFCIMEIEKIIGSWKLIQFANHAPDRTIQLWSGYLNGRLIYSHPDVVSVAINRRANNCDQDLSEFNSFYAGRFKLKGTSTIEHKVEQSSDFKRVGEIYVRAICLVEDRLEISGKGLTGDVALVWKREIGCF